MSSNSYFEISSMLRVMFVSSKKYLVVHHAGQYLGRNRKCTGGGETSWKISEVGIILPGPRHRLLTARKTFGESLFRHWYISQPGLLKLGLNQPLRLWNYVTHGEADKAVIKSDYGVKLRSHPLIITYLEWCFSRHILHKSSRRLESKMRFGKTHRTFSTQTKSNS